MGMEMRAGRPWLRWVGVFALVLSLMCLRAEAAVVRVTPSGAGAKDGSSWADACGEAEFRTVLGGAPGNGATEFWVAAGTYNPTADADRSVSFVLKTGVALYGGFGGTETARTQRNAAGNVTILSGNLGDPASATDNSYHVVTANGTDATAVLDGFTVTGGRADVGNPHDTTSRAGGMLIDLSSVTVANCTFSGNAATKWGGGMFVIACSPTVTNSTFTGNTADLGGAIHALSGGNAVLTGCTLSGNSATSFGGGVYSVNSTPVLTDCTLSGNSATERGGGLYNQGGGNPTLSHCTLSGNSAKYGGGMCVDGGNQTLTGCTLSGNSATDYGGGWST